MALPGAVARPAAAQATPPAGDAPVEVRADLAGAKDLARRALAAGRPALAADIARQILARFPSDAEAHLLLAAALTRAGAPVEAADAARAGFRLAAPGPMRFEAAYLAAEALATAGRPRAARFWLRRADAHAPTPAHAAVLARAHAELAARSRLSFGLALYGGPSENVNGGSLHDTFWFQGIPIPIAEALPGFVAGSRATLTYALSPRTQARLSWSHGEVFLGERARAIDPAAQGSDFRRDELSLGASHVWQDDAGQIAVLGTVSLGRRWTGGTHVSDLARGKIEVRRAMSDTWVVSGTLDLQSASAPRNPVAASITRRLEVQSSHLFPRIGAVTLAFGAAEVDSAAAGVAWRGPSLSLGWRPPLGDRPLDLTFDLAAERRDYWRTPSFDPDLWVGLSVTASLPGLRVMGFEPTLTLNAERNVSDVAVRDTREVGITFGLASSF